MLRGLSTIWVPDRTGLRFPIGRVFGFLIGRFFSQLIPIVLRPRRAQAWCGRKWIGDGLEAQARRVFGAGDAGELVAGQRLAAHDVAQLECEALVRREAAGL